MPKYTLNYLARTRVVEKKIPMAYNCRIKPGGSEEEADLIGKS